MIILVIIFTHIIDFSQIIFRLGKGDMKKNNLFQRFRYWLDKRMAKGTATNVCELYQYDTICCTSNALREIYYV